MWRVLAGDLPVTSLGSVSVGEVVHAFDSFDTEDLEELGEPAFARGNVLGWLQLGPRRGAPWLARCALRCLLPDRLCRCAAPLRWHAGVDDVEEARQALALASGQLKSMQQGGPLAPQGSSEGGEGGEGGGRPSGRGMRRVRARANVQTISSMRRAPVPERAAEPRAAQAGAQAAASEQQQQQEEQEQ